MSDDGKNIIATFQQLRRFCEQISLLLGSVDALMASEGWKPTGNSPVMVGVSYSLQLPRYWIAQDFFRFYKHEKHRNILAFVSVLADDATDEGSLKEPILTAGWFDYGEGTEVGDQWEYEWRRWHLRMPERTDDGKLLSADSEIWPKESLPFRRVSTSGMPLTSIVDVEGLKGNIIEPLLQAIKGSHPS